MEAADLKGSTLSDLAKNVAMQTDAALREALDRHIGSKDWKLEDVAGRATCCHHRDGREVFYLDGVAILEVLPPVLEDRIEGENTVLRLSRKYRHITQSERTQ